MRSHESHGHLRRGREQTTWPRRRIISRAVEIDNVSQITLAAQFLRSSSVIRWFGWRRRPAGVFAKCRVLKNRRQDAGATKELRRSTWIAIGGQQAHNLMRGELWLPFSRDRQCA